MFERTCQEKINIQVVVFYQFFCLLRCLNKIQYISISEDLILKDLNKHIYVRSSGHYGPIQDNSWTHQHYIC